MPGVEVSIIILTYNEEKNIGPCLERVFKQKTDLPFEVLVVDSGSTDRTLDIVNQFDVRLLRIPRPLFSHGRTRQFACENARGEFLVTLVADAMPADERWLHYLVHAVADDERVAGSFSRQLPRERAGPVEAAKVRQRTAGSDKRIESRIDGEREYWSLSPKERLDRCWFDDVSACRRRSVWERIPIPDTPWAEDLAWSRLALLDGWKIVFEPRSAVLHSHAETLRHSFCRAYLDQTVVQDWFGIVYYADGKEMGRGFTHLLYDQQKIILHERTSPFKKLQYTLQNPLRLIFEIAGAVLAANGPRAGHVVFDLTGSLDRACFIPVDARERIMRTRFPLGRDGRPVLFMNPNSAAVFSVRVPERGRLVFAAGINPEARPMRREPVRFIIGLDGCAVFDGFIGPTPSGEEPVWLNYEIDLAQWSGKKIFLSLITRAENTDHAWAGWGWPRITVPELTWLDRLYNAVREAAHQSVTGTPLRHP